ncbi:unnamed protein product [Sphagnum troendelagicum]|uniref:PsbP C-terminal domain-containing protein n=1 Tax=Sphagnum troendelagicum TaxID=128251 RepID=A0ABP0U4H1_9BRYO
MLVVLDSHACGAHGLSSSCREFFEPKAAAQFTAGPVVSTHQQLPAAAASIGGYFACPPLSTPLRSAKPSFPPPRLVVAASILAAISLAYRKYVDRLDGYEFNYPAGWIQVRGAGADVFFRDPVNLDENVLVEISSPSSSKFKGVQDLGSPEQAGKKVLRQYLTEFMSTRLGVRRESNIVATGSRLGDDGRLYYDVEVNVSSYANNNQLAVMPQDRVAQLEWSRRYLSVLGVENSRLYELRLQVPEGAMEREEKDLRGIMDSFRVLKLEA